MQLDKSSEPYTIMEVLQEAIKKERESYDYYHQAALKSTKPATRKMFLTLANWEKEHLEELLHHVNELKAQLEIDRAITGGP
ncbi:MAG: hypothetical protein MRJ65_05540 [Candidatus Brocadiaceae bacterium]|nr:hypothetical protein [Candidatus Brocadiaceae bacterium]